MKKLICFSLVIFLALGQNKLNAQPVRTAAFKGQVSPDTENEDKEPDPPFSDLLTRKTFENKKASSAESTQHVSELENGLQIMKDIVNKLVASDYDFTLISQHKYMVNSCLGLKVSAGEFSLHFANPVVEISNTGKFVIELKVEKIKFSAFKVRTKPCTKIQHSLDPCHFGGKFEIGGEATDLKMKAVVDPIANGMVGTQGFCFFAFEDNVKITWNIGGFNLRPMPNILDNVGKEMVEDALNGGMVDLFYNKFIELSKDIIPQYYSACENAYSVANVTNNLPANVSSSNATSGQKWETMPANIKGIMGRLNSDYPPGVTWRFDIYTSENKFLRNHSDASNLKFYGLAPGIYNIKLNTILVENLSIEKGKETRIRSGILSIASEGNWELRSETKEKFHTSGNKPVKLALPEGNYQLKMEGQFFPVSIKDGATVEF